MSLLNVIIEHSIQKNQEKTSSDYIILKISC